MAENKIDHKLNIINLHKGIHQPDMPIIHGTDNWLVLGYFDSLSLSTMSDDPNKHMLEQVWSDLSKPAGSAKDPAGPSLGIYRHALYLLPGLRNKDVQAFQTHGYPFLFVTRIRKSSGYDDVDSDQTIDKTVRAAIGDADDLVYECYPTLSLSDLILVMSSNSLQMLMEKIKTLFGCPYIGDTYTYCCVNKSAFELPSAEKISASDGIALVTIRLAVRSARRAQKKILAWCKDLENDYPSWMKQAVRQAYFVTGTADVDILLRDTSSYDFIRFLAVILKEGKPEFWEAFDNMITRIGIGFPLEEEQFHGKMCQRKLCSLPCQNDIPAKNALFDAFFSENQKLQQILEGWHESWINPLFKLMNSLIYLSKNRMLDQLCYVLLSSVQGFVVKLQEPMDKFRYVEDLYTFVDQLAFVTEHIIRMESQLVLHPETRPVVFSLPVNTIESYLTFIDLCASFLQVNDTEKKRFFFLIVPCLCETVTVQSLLYDQDETNHLLYIRIPLELCYSPKEVALALAHEIGHYSGETSRNRGYRFNILVHCCTTLLCSLLGLGNNQDDVMSQIWERFYQEIKEDDRSLVKRIEPAMEKACRTLIHDTKFVYELRSMAVAKLDAAQDRFTRLDQLSRQYQDLLDTDGIEYVVDVMKEVQMLAQECYADIAMFSLLSVSPLDYIQLIWKRRDSGIQDLSNHNYKCISRVLLIERISLVLFATHGERVELILRDAKDKIPVGKDHEETAELVDAVGGYCSILSILEKNETLTPDMYREMLEQIPLKTTDKKDLPFHPTEITQALLAYLQTCYQVMPKHAQSGKEDTVDQLYQALCAHDEQIDADEKKTIRDYRNSILHSSCGEQTSLDEILCRFKEGRYSFKQATDVLVQELHLSVENAQTILKVSGHKDT